MLHSVIYSENNPRNSTTLFQPWFFYQNTRFARSHHSSTLFIQNNTLVNITIYMIYRMPEAYITFQRRTINYAAICNW